MLGESQTTGVHQGHVGMLLLLCLSPMKKGDERQGYAIVHRQEYSALFHGSWLLNEGILHQNILLHSATRLLF
jgi:hypothetical protein